jgi:Ankyrin repeats (many copies)
LLLLQALVRAGAKVNATNKWGVAPMHLAIKQQHACAVLCLIALGADAGQVDSCGLTPLHLAARVGMPVIASALLSAGADLNAKTMSACKQHALTPLVVALKMNNPAVVDVLLRAGATLRGLGTVMHALDAALLHQIRAHVRQTSMAGIGSLMHFARRLSGSQDLSLGKDLHHAVLSCTFGVDPPLMRLLLNTEAEVPPVA